MNFSLGFQNAPELKGKGFRVPVAHPNPNICRVPPSAWVQIEGVLCKPISTLQSRAAYVLLNNKVVTT